MAECTPTMRETRPSKRLREDPTAPADHELSALEPLTAPGKTLCGPGAAVEHLYVEHRTRWIHDDRSWIMTPDTGRLLEFIKAAFDGEELARVPVGDGLIGHAEIRVGDTILLAFDQRSD